MKRCPICTRTYDDDSLVFCLEDGTRLVNQTYANDSLKTLVSRGSQTEELPVTEAFQQGVDQAKLPSPKSSFDGQSIPQQSRRKSSSSALKILIVGGGSLVLLLLMVGAIVYFVTRDRPYTGSLTALFPEVVGEYKLAGIREPDEHDKIYGTSEGRLADYKSSSGGPKLGMLVLRYQSSKEAKLGLEKLKAAWLEVANPPQIQEEGVKKKGWSTVGDRFVLSFESGKGVYWTNGALLFTAAGEGSGALDLEKHFLY